MSDYGGGYQGGAGYYTHQQPPSGYEGGGGVSYPSLPAQQELVNVTYSDQQYQAPPSTVGRNSGNGSSSVYHEERASAAKSENGSARFKMTFKGEFGETQSVYCEIGMDGVKLIDTYNGSCLETFPLNVISRWAVRDKDTFLFWSGKDGGSGSGSGTSAKQRQVELKGSAKDVSNILDTITAACMQLCEMIEKKDHQRKLMGEDEDEGEGEGASTSAEKKGFVGWIAGKVKPGSVEDGEDATSAIPEGVEYWKQPDYDGWMQSQGEHIKTWRKRWFVLKDGYLFRFLNDKVAPQSKPRGVINLGMCLEIAKPAKDASQGATIQVTVQKKRSLSKGDLMQNYLLVADSKAERDLWLEIMSRAKTDIQKARETKETSDNKSKYDMAHKEWIEELDEGFKTLQKNKKPAAPDHRSGSSHAPSHVEVLDYNQQVGRGSGTGSGGSYSPSAPRPGQYSYAPPQAQPVQAYQPVTYASQAPQQQPQAVQAGGGGLENWKVCYTPDGRAYYYNTVTGITQWEAP